MMRKGAALAVLCVLFVAAGCQQKDLSGKPVSFRGSYAKSCRNVTNGPDGSVTAECRDLKGKFVASTVRASSCRGDLGNNNGILSCNGATSVPGTLAAAAPPAASDAASAAKP